MANEVRQIAINSNIITDLFNKDNSFADAVVYPDKERTSGNIFVWKNTTGNDNNGTVYKAGNGATQNGEWHMQFDESYVDLKWFGAKGDWTGFGVGTINNTAIQNALDYAVAAGLDVYISLGLYRVDASTASGGSLLHLDASVLAKMRVFGVGPDMSMIVYDDSPNYKDPFYGPDPLNAPDVNILKVTSKSNVIVVLEEFGIRGFADELEVGAGHSYQIRSGTGLYLYKTYPLNVRNMSFKGLNEAIRLDAVNNAKIENCFAQYVKYGIVGDTINTSGINETLPNVLDILSCQFIANDIVAINILNGHTVNVISCDISVGGILPDPYPLPGHQLPAFYPERGGIFMTYDGSNGGNGLNVQNCYFEGNIDVADIRLTIDTNKPINNMPNPYYGTHTFNGNTFNRNNDVDLVTSAPLYTEHNILVIGAGQNPKRLLGQSKCKLVFTGNGFFVNKPGVGNNYVPKPIRRAIEIQYANNSDENAQYWEFDIVEQGNTYAGAFYNGGDEAIFWPTKDLNLSNYPFPGVTTTYPNSRITPQVSEFTRIKAFGSFIGGDEFAGILEASYNVLYLRTIAVATYEVLFANELDKMPVIVATCRSFEGAQYCVPFIERSTTSGFVLKTIAVATGEECACLFDFHVF